MKIVVLTTSYNCENFIDKCLFSIMSQSQEDFECFITDDLSTDGTTEKIKEVIRGDSRFHLIENKEKKYQGGNYNQIIRGEYGILDEDVCVEVDGDDWLPDSNVFQRVNNVYKNDNVWIANGSFKYQDGRFGFSSAQKSFDDIRNKPFTLSHLRTWRAFLWRKIDESDLKDENGNFWRVAGDLSFMYPLVEMSGIEHYKFMPEINYIYNENNPLNDHKINLDEVIITTNKIRNKKVYNKL